jgi:alpha-D-ribose 1-methylphosphonate 5-phosphate C-P lyase
MKPSSNKQDRSGFGKGRNMRKSAETPSTNVTSLDFRTNPQNLKVSPSPASGVAGATSEALSAAA